MCWRVNNFIDELTSSKQLFFITVYIILVPAMLLCNCAPGYKFAYQIQGTSNAALPALSSAWLLRQEKFRVLPALIFIFYHSIIINLVGPLPLNFRNNLLWWCDEMWREATQSETVLVRAILSFYHPPIEYCYFQVDDGEKNAVCLYSRTKSPSLIHTWLNQIKQMKWGISSISSLLTPLSTSAAGLPGLTFFYCKEINS